MTGAFWIRTSGRFDGGQLILSTTVDQIVFFVSSLEKTGTHMHFRRDEHVYTYLGRVVKFCSRKIKRGRPEIKDKSADFIDLFAAEGVTRFRSHIVETKLSIWFSQLFEQWKMPPFSFGLLPSFERANLSLLTSA